MGERIGFAALEHLFMFLADKFTTVGLGNWQGYSTQLTLGKLSYLSCDANCRQYESWRAVDLGMDLVDGGVDLVLDGQNRPRIAYRVPHVVWGLAYAWCNTNCETSASKRVLSSRLSERPLFGREESLRGNYRVICDVEIPRFARNDILLAQFLNMSGLTDVVE